MNRILAALCCAALSACADGALAPQAQTTINGLCTVDGKLQPVAATVVTAASPPAAAAVAADTAVVHPAIIAACAAFGAIPAPAAQQPPAALTQAKPEN